MKIRRAGGEDAGRVRAAYAAFEYRWQLRPEADDTIWIAEDGGKIIGIVRVVAEAGIQVLRGMRVARVAQRSGIGTQLLREVAEWLGKKECWCVPYSHLTGFYSQAGFQLVEPAAAPDFLAERLAAYRKDGLDVVLMRRAAIL